MMYWDNKLVTLLLTARDTLWGGGALMDFLFPGQKQLLFELPTELIKRLDRVIYWDKKQVTDVKRQISEGEIHYLDHSFIFESEALFNLILSSVFFPILLAFLVRVMYWDKRK